MKEEPPPVTSHQPLPDLVVFTVDTSATLHHKNRLNCAEIRYKKMISVYKIFNTNSGQLQITHDLSLIGDTDTAVTGTPMLDDVSNVDYLFLCR